MTRADLTAAWLQAELTAAAKTSDPGRTVHELVPDLVATGIWPTWHAEGTMRVHLSMALRDLRASGLVIYRQGWEYHLATSAADRHLAARWLRQLGPQAIKRMHHVVDYAEAMAVVVGGYSYTDGPALWVATEAQARALESTLVLAYDRSFT
jgi:hypothetical protein